MDEVLRDGVFHCFTFGVRGNHYQTFPPPFRLLHSYSRVMSWDNPALSSISLMAFVYLTLVANAEYLLALLPFSLLIFMTWGFLQRRRGGYVQAWIASDSGGAQGAGESKNAGFR